MDKDGVVFGSIFIQTGQGIAGFAGHGNGRDIVHFFGDLIITDETFEMENDRGLKRTFTINWDERLLQGRGIKGFFSNYTATHLWIGQTEAQHIKVAEHEQPSLPGDNHYYNALIAENDKRKNRKGLSETKQQEFSAKTGTIELERDKQLEEIYNKANGEVQISLENAIVYFVPLL